MLHSLKLYLAMMMTTIDHTRVLTTDQNTDCWEHVDIRVFENNVSCKSIGPPTLKKMLAYVRDGDEVMVYSIDRLARNLPNRTSHLLRF